MHAWRDRILRRERLRGGTKCLDERRRFNRVLRGGDGTNLTVTFKDGKLQFRVEKGRKRKKTTTILPSVKRLKYIHITQGDDGLQSFLTYIRTLTDVDELIIQRGVTRISKDVTLTLPPTLSQELGRLQTRKLTLGQGVTALPENLEKATRLETLDIQLANIAPEETVDGTIRIIRRDNSDALTEVHNTFSEKWGALHPNFAHMEKFVEQFEDNAEQTKKTGSQMLAVIRRSLQRLVDMGNDDALKRKSTQQLTDIFKSLGHSYEISETLYFKIVLVLKFIYHMNNPILTEAYLSSFVDECVNSRGPGSMSCPDGIKERFILSFDSTFKSLCCQQHLCVNENIDVVLKKVINMMCPKNINLILILDAVENDTTFWTYTEKWVAENVDNHDDGASRRQGFIEFMTSMYTAGVYQDSDIAKVREAIKTKVAGMVANFDCVDVEDIFISPHNCAAKKT